MDGLHRIYQENRDFISKNFEKILENPRMLGNLEEREVYSLLANYLYEKSLEIIPRQYVRRSEFKRILPAAIGGLAGLLLGIGLGIKTNRDFLVPEVAPDGTVTDQPVAWAAGGWHGSPVEWQRIVKKVGNYILFPAGTFLAIYLGVPASILTYLVVNAIRGYLNRRRVKRLLKRMRLFFKKLEEKGYSEITHIKDWEGTIRNLEKALSRKGVLSLGIYIIEAAFAAFTVFLGLEGARIITSGFEELSKMTRVPRNVGYTHSSDLPPPPKGYESWTHFIHDITMNGYNKLKEGVSKIKNALYSAGAYVASLIGGILGRRGIDKKYAGSISRYERTLEEGLEDLREEIVIKVPHKVY